MSSDTENEMCAPLDTVNASPTEGNGLLPEKSRSKYEKVYKDFMEWSMTTRTTSMSENAFLAYFEDLSKKFSPASLWTYHSMLKNMLIIKHDVDLARFFKLTAFLKQKSEGYKAKKAKTFSPEEMNRFLNEAPDKVYLQSKVGLIFGIMGACRREELYNLKFKDVQVSDKTIFVTIRKTKSKTYRTFTLNGWYSELCKKYMDLRPADCSEPSFFLSYSLGKCSLLKVGINKFGGLGKTIAEFLDLPNPEMYTGHCFRRTSAAFSSDAGTDITTLKTQGQMLSDESVRNKEIVSNQVIHSIQNKDVVNININMPSTSNQDPFATNLQAEQLHISHCNTVNVYNCYNKETCLCYQRNSQTEAKANGERRESIYIKVEKNDLDDNI